MKKRILSILLTLCMVLMLCPVTAFADESPDTLIGDLDLDGEVTVRDAVHLQNYLEGLESFTDKVLKVADFNGDGEVNYSDWIALQSYLISQSCLVLQDITVENGKATACGTEISKAANGTRVTLTADSPSDNMVFDKWIVNEGSVTLADASSATTTFTMPADPVSVTATYKQKYNTLTVPFTTTVKLGGNAAPGKTVFKLEIVDSQGEKLGFDGVEVTAAVTTNGKGSYKGSMTLTGSLEDLFDMLGEVAFVKQVDERKANWTYDDTVWGLFLWNGAELATDDAAAEYTVLIFPTICEEDYDGVYYNIDWNSDTLDEMTFTNTYTYSAPVRDTTTIVIGGEKEGSKPVEENPNTGAPVAANMSTLSVLTVAAAAVAVLKTRKR